jgi:hypothetical protein
VSRTGCISLSAIAPDTHGPLVAQQPVERHDAGRLVGGIDHDNFIEFIGQRDRVAHVIDRLADAPERRHGNKVRLHETACRLFRIFRDARKGDSFAWRDLRQHLRLILWM